MNPSDKPAEKRRLPFEPQCGPWKQFNNAVIAGLEVGMSSLHDSKGKAVEGVLVAFGPWLTDAGTDNIKLVLFSPALLFELWRVSETLEWWLIDDRYANPVEMRESILAEAKVLGEFLETVAPGYDPTPKQENDT